MEKINKEFNLSGKRLEKQKERLAEDARQAKTDQIRNVDERNKTRNMMMRRNEKVKIQKEKDRLQEEKLVQQHIRAKSAATVELRLTIKNAQAKKDPKQIEKAIRHNIKITHGAEMEKLRGNLRNGLNNEIDGIIDHHLENQNQQTQKKNNEFEKNALKMTVEPLSKPWEASAPSKDNKRPWQSSRGREND
ncbi:MAG: hypothetical protein JKY08_07740 [Flavobacteriaceae bacterium]|nr:hypothetical protein [Flavobacteriaceae bacterium]